MGKLISSQKTIAGVSGLKPNTYYRVKSLLGSIYLSEIFNATDSYNASVDTISIWQNGDINLTPITALNADPEWINPNTNQNIDNTLIPVGAVILINSNTNHSYSGAVLVNYYQGKTSIKKQNLSVLIPFQIGADVYPNNLYTFKSATTNLLGTVFNPSLFNTAYGDTINITPPNQLANETFYFDGSTWLDANYTPSDNYIIPNDSLIQIQTNNISSVPVGGGAIIQKYNSGKIIAPKGSKYELIFTISPINEIYKIYTNNIDPQGISARTSKNEYDIEIIKDEGTFWFTHFRNINNGYYCNSFFSSDNEPEDFRDVNWDNYAYNDLDGCPNLNYTRLDILINQRY